MLFDDRLLALDTTTLGSFRSEYPSAATLPSGGYVVAWVQDRIPYFQVFDASGVPIGRAAPLTTEMGYRPKVAALGSGGFVAVWEGSTADDSLAAVARIYDEAGNPLGEPFAANSTLFAGQQQPSVAGLASGGFVVVWTDQNGDASGSGIKAQMFTAEGAKLGAEFPVNSVTAGEQYAPKIVGLADGRFFITWIDSWYGSNEKPSNPSYSGQLFDANGRPVGGEIELAPFVTPGGDFAVEVLPSDRLLIVWADPQGDLRGQIFSSGGEKVGSEFPINDPASLAASMPDLAQAEGGGFWVTWRVETGEPSYIRSGDIRAQAFDAVGNRVGAEHIINPVTDFGQTYPQIVSFGSGDLVILYQSYNEHGEYGLLSRLLLSATTGSSAADLLVGGDGPDALLGRDGGDRLEGHAGDDALIGGAGDDHVFGGDGNDQLFLEDGGVDRVEGGAGHDGLYFGNSYTALDEASGGTGIDSLALQGNYSPLLLGKLTGIEVLVLLSGSDGRFGDGAGNSYQYDIRTTDDQVGSGALLVVHANGLTASEALRFDGSAEIDGGFRVFAGRGVDRLVGGAGQDGFFFDNGDFLTGADIIDGGANRDSIAVRGNYHGENALRFTPSSMTNVEFLVLLSGKTNEFGGLIEFYGFDYEVVMHDANVGAGARMEIVASLAAGEDVSFDGRGETDGSFRIVTGAGNDIIHGSRNSDLISTGLGSDWVDGGEGADLYIYRSAEESSRFATDTLVLGGGDRIDLSFLDANGNAADGNQAFAFIGADAFGNVAGQLRAYQANGGWIVEADVDGNGVADLVINVTTPLTITAEMFIP